MYAFRRVMIGLDFTLMDQGLIRYAAALCSMIEPEQLVFVNVQPQLELPPELKEEFPQFEGSPAEQLRQELQQVVNTHFEGFDRWAKASTFSVIEGSPRKELLRQAQQMEIDLLVMGRKHQQRGSGTVPVQVARRSHCSVLFVPEQPPANLRKILVGCDFSRHAQMALQEALNLQEHAPTPVEIALQHVYQVPMGYYKTGRTEGQFAALMRQHAEKRLIKFADEYDLDLSDVEKVFTYDRSKSSPALLLHQEGHQRQADLIVVAARGLSGLSALFLGSITEKLVKLEGSIPVLVVKQKGQSYDLKDLIEDI